MRAATLIVLLCLLPLAATAGERAVVTSSLFRAMPPEGPVRVEVYDDSDLNLEVRRRFVAALQERGVEVTSTAELELMLDLRVSEGRLEVTRPSLGEAQSTISDSRVEFNVLSNTEDSVLGGTRTEPSEEVREGLVNLNAQLRDLQAREIVWQGDATTRMDPRGLYRLAPLLAPPLAESYGRSVGNQEVRLER